MIKLNYPNFWQSKNLIAILLLPFSVIFYCLGVIRALISPAVKLPAPVICIGNITVGGTGKTPVVIELAKRFLAQNLRVAIICKGYTGNYSRPLIVTADMPPLLVGDEAIELATKLFPNLEYNEQSKIPHSAVIAARKVTETKALLDLMRPDIILVDDSLQNPSFVKDFRVVVIDHNRNLGNHWLLPAGPLRQSIFSATKNLDALILTGHLLEEMKQSTIKKLLDLKEEQFFIGEVKPLSLPDTGGKYLAAAGIGNPSKFYNMLYFYKFKIAAIKSYPDHYNYQKKDVSELEELANKISADAILTTDKDYVKLAKFTWQVPLINCPINIEIHNIDQLMKKINEKIAFKKD